MDTITGFQNSLQEKLKKSAWLLRMISNLLHIKATAIYNEGKVCAQKFKAYT